MFDLESKKKAKPKRKLGSVSGFMLPAQGAQGVRQHHKINVENIPANRRAQIPDSDIDLNMQELYRGENLK